MQNLIKSQTGKIWTCWIMAVLFYMYELILRFAPGVMAEDLMMNFNVTSTSLGILSSMYYYTYVPLQVPCGWLVDKFGARLVVTVSCLLCAIGTLIMAQTDSLALAGIGRAIVGAGSACAFISCLVVVAHNFPVSRFAFLAGLSNMSGSVGGIIAGAPLAELVNTLGWRTALYSLSIFGIVLASLCYILITDDIRNPTKSSTIWHNLKRIFRLPQVLLAGIVGGIMYVPISVFSELWAIPFFMSTYHVSNTVAAVMGSSMVCFGMMLGAPLAPIIGGYMQRYLSVMKLSTASMALIFSAISFGSYIPAYAMYILCFALGVMAGAQVLCFTFAKNASSDSSMEGTVMGVTNGLIMLVSLILQPLIGRLLDMFWDGTLLPSGMPCYAQDAYQYAILAMPACLVLCYIALKFVKESYQHH